MKGSKLDVWEGGIHVPGFANWPGRISPKEISAAVHVVDWFPTLAGLIGYEPEHPTELDGVDLSPLLFGNGSIKDRSIYWINNPEINRWALRFGDYKILVMSDHPTPIDLRTHVNEPVPFAIYSSEDESVKNDKFVYTENSAATSDVYIPEGWRLMGMLVGKEI